jgi:sulfite exporter TauE/SafE
MVAFGAGTVPALVFFSAGLRKLTMRDVRIRRVVAAGVFLLAMGSVALRQGLLPRGEHTHGPAAHAAMSDMNQAEGQ